MRKPNLPRWQRPILGALLIWALDYARMPARAFPVFVALSTLALMWAFSGLLGTPRRRPHAEAPTKPAPELATPDAGPDTCRVCGLGDLAYWDDLDASFGAVGEDRHVVGYGSGRAHRDCALVVPYVAPRVDPQRRIVHALQSATPQPGDPIPDGYRRMGRLDSGSTPGAYCLSVDARYPNLPSGSVIAICSGGVVRESAVVDHAVGSVTSVVVCREPLRYAHPADAVVYASPLPPEPPVMPPVNGPLAALMDSRDGRFLASVRVACGIMLGPGEPEPSNIASDLINAGVLSVDDARRMAAESMPVVNGALRDSLGAYWTCQYCNTRRRADSEAAAEKALRKHSGSCAERRAGGVFSQACAAIPADNGRPAFCLAHNQGDPRCTVYETAG